ncbi:hypothetical protein ACHAXR_009795 [Thalassiosira sp. AJA248-18]
MACITKRAIGNTLLSVKRPNSLFVGVFDTLGHPRWRPQHRHRHQQRSLVTKNALCYSNASAAAFSDAKGNCRHRHIERRHSNGTPITAETQPAEHDLGNKNQSTERRPKSFDPTAKRPTQKCDPYGLQGESLPYKQCLDWMTTLEDGWVLLQSENDDANNNNFDDTIIDHAAIIERTPVFLQKQYYHPTFHEASQFLSHIALLATNLNHFPFLSMERILVDDLNNIHGDHKHADSNDNNATAKIKKRKIKGWVFRSTIRCSTYRPPTAGSTKSGRSLQTDGKGGLHKDQGLTYHDFHLALNVDVELNREEVKRLLWKSLD